MSGTTTPNTLTLTEFITAIASQIGNDEFITIENALSVASAAQTAASAAETQAQSFAAVATLAAAQAAAYVSETSSISLHGYIVLENMGTNVGTLPLGGTLDATGSGTFALSGTTAEFNAGTGDGGGGGGGTLGLYYGGTLYETVVAGSNITITPGTGSFAGVLTLSGESGGGGGGGGGGSGAVLTNGTVSYGPFATLTVNNLDLQPIGGEAAAPVVVQRTSNFGATSVGLAAPSTAGNTIILLLHSRDGASTPAGWTLQTSFSPGGGTDYVFSKSASETLETVDLTALGGRYAYQGASIQEISGAAFFSYASGACGVSGSEITFTAPAVSSIPSIILSIIGNDPNGTGSPSAPLPSGSTINFYGTDGNFNCMAVLTSGTITSEPSPTVGITYSGPINEAAFACVVIAGADVPGSAEITPTIPVELNGTAAGAFQSMAIVAGNSATSVSLIDGTLVINLDVPITVSSVGSYELVSVQTISAEAVVQFTGFEPNYSYKITGDGVEGNGNGYLALQIGTGSGPTWDTGNSYSWTAPRFNSTPSGQNDTSFHLSGTSYTYSAPNSLRVTIDGDAGVAQGRSIHGLYSGEASECYGAYNPQVTITGAQIFWSSGDISGVFRLWKMPLS